MNVGDWGCLASGSNNTMVLWRTDHDTSRSCRDRYGRAGIAQHVVEEVVEADEQTLFEGFAREITARQKEVATETGGPLRRGFHAKLHAGLMAEFKVLPDLPEHARYGVFSAPRIFPAVVRFSNESLPLSRTNTRNLGALPSS